MQLPKYSIGIGDRFAHQGKAQLRAFMKARSSGARIAPVWNKSHREHTIVGTRPEDVRAEADAATAAMGWTDPYFVDADHIGLAQVERFAPASDFFTIDVAEWIGRRADENEIAAFVSRQERFLGALKISGIAAPLQIDRQTIERTAASFLAAVQEAEQVFHKIVQCKGTDDFVTEISMDETAQPQTPVELLFILAAVAERQIPAGTVAPRFSGRFNKGVDYVGDAARFAREFEDHLAVLAFAVNEFGLPRDLKLSIHSGSDKFSIYGPVRRALEKFDAGIHLKTAGTTWLEEIIGLAAAGGDGLLVAKQIYRGAFARREELCAPYASVIDIDPVKLPSPQEVDRWDEEMFVSALRHDPTCPAYNPHLRQLLHVGYKVAAELRDRYLDALERYAETVGQNVTENLYARHIKPLFLA
ncbi:MAG TPA: tagaturonate epimerase family protein [Thermoguttaceae bacterium]|nr:tagaturonate epimerase family protein [Thermoguttaceae bacterium]